RGVTHVTRRLAQPSENTGGSRGHVVMRRRRRSVRYSFTTASVGPPLQTSQLLAQHRIVEQPCPPRQQQWQHREIVLARRALARLKADTVTPPLVGVKAERKLVAINLVDPIGAKKFRPLGDHRRRDKPRLALTHNIEDCHAMLVAMSNRQRKTVLTSAASRVAKRVITLTQNRRPLTTTKVNGTLDHVGWNEIGQILAPLAQILSPRPRGVFLPTPSRPPCSAAPDSSSATALASTHRPHRHCRATPSSGGACNRACDARSTRAALVGPGGKPRVTPCLVGDAGQPRQKQEAQIIE